MPQTVTVIPGTIIREQGARNLTEVLRATPGITFEAGENGFATSTNNFKLRGFDAAGNIFVDGARDSGSFPRDMFNIDRVEVIKGAAADNGRGGAGGYINLVTKAPVLGNFVHGDLRLGWDQYGSEMRKRATTDINQSVGTVGVRLNTMVEDGGVAGRDIAEAKGWGIAPSITFGLGTPFRATVAYEHLSRNDLPDWGVPGASVRGTALYNPIAGRAARDNFYGLRSDYDKVDADSVTARFEYDLSRNWTISNQTRWSHVERYAGYTVPTGYTAATQLVGTQRQYYGRVNDTITNQTNLAGTFVLGGFKHELSTGVEITREDSDGNRYPTAAGGNTNIFSPNPDRTSFITPAPTQRNRVEVDTVAGYIYDRITLSPQWQLQGGLRLENYDVRIDSKTAAGVPISPNGYEDSVTSLGGKVGLVYKPVSYGSFYASYGTSVLPPGSFMSNPDISREGDNAFPGFVPNADPIRLHNYEIGTKWDWMGGRLSTTAALFRTEKHQVPITGRDVGETVDSLKGYGQQIIQGLELGIAGKLTESWKMFGGVLIMDSERQHSARLDDVRRRANPADYGTRTRTSGDELAFVPNFSANLWTTYDVTQAWTIGGGIQYVGEQWVGRPDDALRIIPNGNAGKLPSYFLVNLMTSYKLSKNIDLRLNVDNVFDEKYAQAINWAANRATLGAPRTYWLSTSVKF